MKNRTWTIKNCATKCTILTVLIHSMLSVVSFAADKPNIIVIITDQQHAGMMSCAGNQHLQTPALDKLAKDGIRFTHAYVTNPVCVPSRISMATGVMAGRFGVLNNGMRATMPREVSENSLGQLMKNAGYDTFYGGKTHMSPELEPRRTGYDETFKDEREALPGACIDFIERDRHKPFFAVASFINPHDICFAYQAYQIHTGTREKAKGKATELYEIAAAMPMDQLPPLPDGFQIPTLEPAAIELNLKSDAVTPSGTIRQVYDEREWRIYRWIYCRLTEQVDDLIGRILTAVERNGLDESTLIVFTSDHGDMDSCHRLASKGVFYENSSRVGFLMKYSGHIIPGKVEPRLVSSGLDLLPTLCDYAGIKVPEHCLGRSLRPIAEGKFIADWRDYVVTENHTGRMLRSEKFKYCVYHEGKPRESLVDLQSDPDEMNNLVADPSHRDALNQHRIFLQQWIELSGDAVAKSFAAEGDAIEK
jgi:arylsulfatase A-like enzyme